MTITPQSFLQQLGKRPPAPVYLFLGPEHYGRDACRRALLEAAIGEGDREDGFVRHDLEESGLASVLDDARSLSLFAPQRLIWVARAEAALPRGRAMAQDDNGESAGGSKESAANLEAYLESPSPGVVVVFDCSRYEFDGEDKSRSERVRKFFAAAPVVVEFARLGDAQARAVAVDAARDLKVKIGGAELDLLVEAVGGSAMNVCSEMEKLAHYTQGRPVTAADIEALVPQARSTTIFALVNALGRRDRQQALHLLDTLLRDGEYLPLALSFLGAQFRQALTAHEAKLHTGREVLAYFSKQGVPMWPSRAEQVAGTVRAFGQQQVERAIERIGQADRDLRDTRPDDRVVMEKFVIALTS